MSRRLLPTLPLLAACTAGDADNVVVYVQPAERDAFLSYLVGVPGAPGMVVTADPVGDAEAGVWGEVLHPDVPRPGEPEPVPWAEQVVDLPDMQVAVLLDLTCTECFELTGEGNVYTVHAGDRLGAQYGLTALLEAWGYRFYHPFAGHKPDVLKPLDATAGVLGVRHAPDIARRGLHLHTLHPIEALDAFWLPGERSLERAERILDWAVKSRANHVQWVSLDDITDSPATAAAWQDHTRQVVQMAHDRGLTTGMGIQLFGQSNLQNAFDLVDGDPDPTERRAMMDARLAVITDDVGLDELNLSFGEFFNADPAAFVATVDEAYAAAQAAQPDIGMSTVIHVGDSEDQRVTYQGEEMIYYFLARYADPAIQPWVHTVMYYNLFEDAGGAYHHDAFDEHRAFLLQRLQAGEDVAYFPETAYWVAFDDSVPTYLPLYMRSRWTDLAEIRAAVDGPGLQDHVLFSTGWEWGYWQNDYTALRMSYTLRPWQEEVADLYSPFGDEGAELADAVVQVADIEHEALIGERLAPYLAGRDAAMDVGFAVGVVAAPERPAFSDVAGWSDIERTAFQVDVVDRLDALAAGLDGRGDRVRRMANANGSPWFVEMADAIQVTNQRARFAHATWSAAVTGAAGGDPTDDLARAAQHLATARQLVDDRHDTLWDPDGPRLTTGDWANPTIYQYGYLHQAEVLCYWEKELVEVRRALDLTTDIPAGCF